MDDGRIHPINNHTFARDQHGNWHLIGITHREPDIPLRERYFTAERSIPATEAKVLRRDLREAAERAKRDGTRWFDAHDERQFAHAAAPHLTAGQWRKRPLHWSPM